MKKLGMLVGSLGVAGAALAEDTAVTGFITASQTQITGYITALSVALLVVLGAALGLRALPWVYRKVCGFFR